MIRHQVAEELSRQVMYTKDKSDSIFELSPMVVKFADSHNFSTSWDFLIINRDAWNIKESCILKIVTMGYSLLHLFSIISPGGKILCRPQL